MDKIDVEREMGQYANGRSRDPVNSDDDEEEDSDYKDDSDADSDAESDTTTKAKETATAPAVAAAAASKPAKKTTKALDPTAAAAIVADSAKKPKKAATKKKPKKSTEEDTTCPVCHDPPVDGIIIPRCGLFRETCLMCAAKKMCQTLCDTCGGAKLLPLMVGLRLSCDTHGQYTMRCKSCMATNTEALSVCTFCRDEVKPAVDVKHQPTPKDEKATLRSLVAVAKEGLGFYNPRCDAHEYCAKTKGLKACKGCDKFMCQRHLDSCEIVESGSSGCLLTRCVKCVDECGSCSKRCCSRCCKYCPGCDKHFCKICIAKESTAPGKSWTVEDSDDEDAEYVCSLCKSDSDSDDDATQPVDEPVKPTNPVEPTVTCSWCDGVTNLRAVHKCDGPDCTSVMCSACHFSLSSGEAAQVPVLCKACFSR